MAHAGSLLLQVSPCRVRTQSESSAVSSPLNCGSYSTKTSSSSTARSLPFGSHSRIPSLPASSSIARTWVAGTKPPFGGGGNICFSISLGDTHRVAISNHRLVSFEHDRVSFRRKDYAHGGKQKVMTVSAEDFLRRFLIHVLPRGLVRIRHFGLFANRHRAASLARCRSLLGVSASAALPDATANQLRCPVCSGPMLIIERMTTSQPHFRSDLMPQNQPRYVFDSS